MCSQIVFTGGWIITLVAGVSLDDIASLSVTKFCIQILYLQEGNPSLLWNLVWHKVNEKKWLQFLWFQGKLKVKDVNDWIRIKEMVKNTKISEIRS